MSTLLNRRIFPNLFYNFLTKQPATSSRNVATVVKRLSPTLTSCHPQLELYRFKQTKSAKKRLQQQKQAQSDEEEEVLGQEEDFDSLLVDKHTKIATVKVNNLRVDLVLKSGLYMARNKVDQLFYESRIRINGRKVLKKSDPVAEGDEVDIVKGFDTNNPKFLNVARVEILEVKPKSESFALRLRRSKTLTIDNYEDPWQGD